jgi:hypothetical protein
MKAATLGLVACEDGLEGRLVLSVPPWVGVLRRGRTRRVESVGQAVQTT